MGQRAMITASRIVKAKHATTAFDGEGARLAGGRWNLPGTRMVYAASSAALAALEMLVHLRPASFSKSYVIIPCTFDEALVSRLDRSKLPDDWRDYPAPPALQMLGDDWLRRRRSPVLEVPSAIITTEANYLLNPAHPEFPAISVHAPQAFAFDRRLLNDGSPLTPRDQL